MTTGGLPTDRPISKNAKVKIRKAKAMPNTKSDIQRINAFREVIIPEKTSYKFKLSDVFEVNKQKKKS